MKRPSPACRRPRAQRGAMLLEVLISILICAFGLLGFVAMQARASSAEFESYQRTQALALLEDMVSRINANRANAGDYVVDGLIGGGDLANCSSMSGAELDLCEWGNLIRGASERRGSSNVGAMISARGCITRPTTSSDLYVVSVVWQGMVPTGGAANSCGQENDAFPTETLRRAVSATVCVGLLRDPDTPASLPRC